MMLISLVSFGLAACGEDTVDAGSSTSSDPDRRDIDPAEPEATSNGDRGPGITAPPPVRVHYGDEFVDLKPWTFCFENGCADGMPPRQPPDVGSPEQVVITYPLEGWSFKASFQAAGEPCGRRFPTKLEEVEPGRFVLRTAGYSGEYDVTLEGRRPGEDIFATFRWTTPADGPLPSPSAFVGIIAGNDDGPGSYGVEMSVRQLAETPDEVDATITVTAADGDSMTFSPRLTRPACEDGSLWWDGPDAKGHEAAALGPPPFAYDVRLVLDGRTYEAHATWPDDLIPYLTPYVRLDFTPELPALS